MYFQNTWDINEILILKIILLKISELLSFEKKSEKIMLHISKRLI